MVNVDNELKPIGKDAGGYDVLTAMIKSLLNYFPGLYPDEEVMFEELGEESGIAFSNDTGALVYAETEDILGGVYQTCQYPFYVVYRASGSAKERQKMSIQEFLDTLGKWICQEPVTIGEYKYKLDRYPDLSGGRKITKVIRDNSYGTDPQENGVQDWLLPITVSYTNEFER